MGQLSDYIKCAGNPSDGREFERQIGPGVIGNTPSYRGETAEERAAWYAAKDAAIAEASASVSLGDSMAVPAGPFEGWTGVVVALAPLTVRLVVFGKEQDYVV